MYIKIYCVWCCFYLDMKHISEIWKTSCEGKQFAAILAAYQRAVHVTMVVDVGGAGGIVPRRNIVFRNVILRFGPVLPLLIYLIHLVFWPRPSPFVSCSKVHGPKRTCHLGVNRHVTLAQADMSSWRKQTCHLGASRHVTLEQADMSLWRKRTCPFRYVHLEGH